MSAEIAARETKCSRCGAHPTVEDVTRDGPIRWLYLHWLARHLPVLQSIEAINESRRERWAREDAKGARRAG